MMGPSSEKPVSDLIRRLIDSFRVEDTEGLVPFFQEWTSIIGTDYAAHCRIVDLRNRTLIVQVDHPAWFQRIHMDRIRIVRRINQRYPNLSVDNIHFYVGAFEDSGDRPSRRRNESFQEAGVPTLLQREGATDGDAVPIQENIDVSGASDDSAATDLGSREEKPATPPELADRFERLRQAIEEKAKLKRSGRDN